MGSLRESSELSFDPVPPATPIVSNSQLGESFTGLIEGLGGSLGSAGRSAEFGSSFVSKDLSSHGFEASRRTTVENLMEHPDWDCSHSYLSSVFETLSRNAASPCLSHPDARALSANVDVPRVNKKDLLRAVQEGTELDLLAACLEGGKARLLGCLQTHPALMVQSPGELNRVDAASFVEAVQDIAASYMEETGRLELCLCSDYNQVRELLDIGCVL